jgi:hypothetical protein
MGNCGCWLLVLFLLTALALTVILIAKVGA